MKKWFTGFLILLSGIFSAFSAVAEEPIYTGFFSNKALDGYDTVAYFTHNRAMKGEQKFKLEYMGADWYFVSQANLDKFKTNPNKYAPQYGGYCAWAVAEKKDFAPGDPNNWSIIDGKLYLNYNRDIKNKWLENSDNFIQLGDQHWPMLFSIND